MSVFEVLRLLLYLLSPAVPSGDIESCMRFDQIQLRIQACTAVIENDGYAPELQAHALTNRGLAYSELGDMPHANPDFDRAIVILTDVLAKNPRNTAALLSRGRAYRASGDLKRGIADYDTGTRIDPLNVDFYNSRCWARAIAGIDLDLARKDCDEALRLWPGAPDLHNTRALVALKQHDFVLAWVDYDTAFRAWPGPTHLYGRGIASLRMGDTAKGEADIAEALRQDPKVADMFKVLGITP